MAFTPGATPVTDITVEAMPAIVAEGWKLPIPVASSVTVLPTVAGFAIPLMEPS
jgi:hypothetical protein